MKKNSKKYYKYATITLFNNNIACSHLNSPRALPRKNAIFFYQAYSTNQNALLPPLPKAEILRSLASKPVKIYSELANLKSLDIVASQECCVYALVSKKTKHIHIGGTESLSQSLKDYHNEQELALKIFAAERWNRPISALTEIYKHGLKDFELYILEYSDRHQVGERMGSYLDKHRSLLTETSPSPESKLVFNTQPVLTYYISDKTPLERLKGKVWYDNKDKVGIYRLVNRTNKKSFIGASLNLGATLSFYFRLSLAGYMLKSPGESPDKILKQAILKHNLTNFSIEILTYCSAEELKEKELYYINLLNPQYNFNKPAKKEELSEKSTLTAKSNTVLTEQSLPETIIREESLGEKDTTISNNSLSLVVSASPRKKRTKKSLKIKKTWTLSETTRQKQSLAQSKRLTPPAAGIKVQVQDLTDNKITIYASIFATCQTLKISTSVIARRLKLNIVKPYKKRYLISKA